MTENISEKITEKVVTEVAQAAVEGTSWKDRVLKGAAIAGGVGIGSYILVKLYRKFGPKPEPAEQA